MSPAQQAPSTAPQLMQMFGPPEGCAQPNPALHAAPVQHSCPSPPHGWHVIPPSRA
jgi:hypothetical protein